MAKAAMYGYLTGLRRPDKPWLDGCPRMIFVSDMGDALSESVSFEYLEAEIIDNVITSAGRRHRWLWVTKRPKRMAEFSAWLKDWNIGWPENLWAGTTVTTDSTTGRLDDLFGVGDEQTTRFLSLEPQLEYVDLRDHLHGLDWVIQGGESGGNPRPFDIEWAELTRKHCQEANVPYYLKQVGAYPRFAGERVRLKDSHGGDWFEWGEWAKDLRVREVPAGAASGDDHSPPAPDATEPAVLPLGEQGGETLQATKLFTIGYGGRKPSEFPSLLKRHGIKTIIDVRLRPNRACMGSYVKAKTADKGIVALLSGAGIDYRHEPDLAPTDGILTTWMESKRSDTDWALYEDQFIPVLEERKIEKSIKLGDFNHACLLCSESKPEKCHRRLIAEYLRDKLADKLTLEIVHL